MTIWLPDISDRAGPRYQAIAEALANDVEAGRLTPGERLPTHRELAERLSVTVGTVSRAYAEATRRGLVSGEVGRGTYVRRAAGAHLRAEAPEGLIDLSLNLPPGPVGEAATLRDSLRHLSDHADLGELLDYGPNAGWPRHREAGATWIRRLGLEADAERVVVCTGGQHALAVVLLAVLRPGAVVLTESLTYPGMKTLASLLQIRLEPVAIDAQGLLPDALDAACRRTKARALYCIPTIQNPTTGTLDAERRDAIAEIARRHELLVVEDDIHGALPAEAPLPLSARVPERAYYVASTGKCLFPGLRVGYVLTPPGRAREIATGLRATTWMASPLLAEVAASWIADGTAERVLQARRREAAARQVLARERLGHLRYASPDFGYHLWLELPEPWRADEFAAAVRRDGVVVAPATDFAVGRGEAPHAVRLSLSAPRRHETLTRALDVVAGTLRSAPLSSAIV